MFSLTNEEMFRKVGLATACDASNDAAGFLVWLLFVLIYQTLHDMYTLFFFRHFFSNISSSMISVLPPSFFSLSLSFYLRLTLTDKSRASSSTGSAKSNTNKSTHVTLPITPSLSKVKGNQYCGSWPFKPSGDCV